MRKREAYKEPREQHSRNGDGKRGALWWENSFSWSRTREKEHHGWYVMGRRRVGRDLITWTTKIMVSSLDFIH